MHNIFRNQLPARSQTIYPETCVINLDDICSLINNPDFFIPRKQNAKTCGGTLKGKALGLPYNVFLKRFSPRNSFNSVLSKLFGSRARRLYKINVILYGKGLPVPRPVACIEPSYRQKYSFYLSALIENAVNLHHFYKQCEHDKAGNLGQELADTIAKWHMAGAVHRDLKWPNILVQRTDPLTNYFLVDLDKAGFYDKPNIKGMVNDLARFYRSGLELGAEAWVDSCFSPAYLNNLPENLRSMIDLAVIRKQALKKWHKNGQIRYCT